MWKLNTHLTKQWVNKSQGELKILKMNENENTTYQNLQDAAKAVLRRKLIAINVYI